MRVGHRRGRLAADRVLQHVLADEEHVVLEQRALHLHAAAGDAALDQRAHRADGAEHAAHDVVDAAAGAQRVARAAGHVGQAAHHLHHLVERGAVLVGAGQEALVADVDQPLVVLRERGVVEPEPGQRAGLEVLCHDVGRQRQPARRGGTLGRLQVDADALLVAVEQREEAGAGTEQPARVVAVHRLDLDDLGAEVGQHHAAGRPHHHVRELDHPQPGQRLRDGALLRLAPRRAGRRLRRGHAAAVSVRGNPARQMLPCRASPASHCAMRPRSAIRASKSRPVGTPMLANR
jgi:hypothetical protein